MICLPRADHPLVFAAPTSLSFGLLRRGRGGDAAPSRSPTPAAERAPGRCAVRQLSARHAGVALQRAATRDRPGHPHRCAPTVSRRAARPATGAASSSSRAAAQTRRIPYWLRVDACLGSSASRGSCCEATGRLPRQHAQAARARVTSYRYPASPGALGLTHAAARAGAGLPLRAPPARRQLGRGHRSRRRAARTSRRGSSAPATRTASPATRRCRSGINPYQPGFYGTRAGGRRLPSHPGRYDLVFDTPTASAAGQLHLPLLGRRHDAADRALLSTSRRAEASRSGSSWPTAARASTRARSARRSTGTSAAIRYSPRDGLVHVALRRLSAGRHRLVFTASDYQETKNTEDASGTLPEHAASRHDLRRAVATLPARSNSSIVGKLLEVALDAGGEVVALGAQQLQLRLPLGAFALAASLEPDPLAEPRPLGADHRHDGAGEERDRQPAHAVILPALNHRPAAADKPGHELARDRRAIPRLLGHSDARPLRSGGAAAADLRPLWASVRAAQTGRDSLLLRPLTQGKARPYAPGVRTSSFRKRQRGSPW